MILGLGYFITFTPKRNCFFFFATFICNFSTLRVPDILLDHTLTTVKVVMQCLQIPHTPLASLSILVPRLRLGDTLVHMHPHSSNGSPASSLHRTIMEIILSVQHIHQRGQGLELVLHHLINPRCESAAVSIGCLFIQ